MKKQTLHTIQALKHKSEPIAVLTAYDYTFGKLLSEQNVEILLIGDSLGMVIQGHQSTVPVSMANMIYHTQCVANGNSNAWLIADLPYMAYASEKQAFKNAAKLMQAGANMVKVEGGRWLNETVEKLVERGVPVCAHLGLTPQSVDSLGGYKVQGRDEENAKVIINDALAIEKAGAQLLVLECIPQILGEQITKKLRIPTIGIGAGNRTDGQVLVLQDMLGMNKSFQPKFAKNFLELEQVNSISEAIASYVSEVKARIFPGEEHSFE